MSRRRQKDVDTGRGSPWDLAKLERSKIDWFVDANDPKKFSDVLRAAADAERDAMLTTAGKMGEIAFQVDELSRWAVPRCPGFVPDLERIRDELIALSAKMVHDAGGAP